MNKVNSQSYIDYYNLRNESIFEFYQENYDKADSLMELGINLVFPFPKDVYYLAVINAQLANKNKTEKYLLLAQHLNGISNNWLQKDEKIFLQTVDSLWYSEFQQSVCKSNETYYKTISVDTLNEKLINTIIIQDQLYRSGKFEGIDNSQHKKDSLMHENDIKVQESLIQFVLKNGWPKGNELLSTVLIHFTQENYENYKELILEQVKLGNLDPYWYARMVDRLERLYYDNNCYYGIWGGCENVNTQNLIKRKLEIGLPIYWNGPFRLYSKVKFIE